MLNCDQVTRLCSDELERPLSAWERLSLKVHMMMCTGCANYRTQVNSIRAAMTRYAEGRAISGGPDERSGK